MDNVERISVEDGLSHSLVWDIHQDRQGFLWLGTANELNRYDGYDFKAYRHDPHDPDSLSESRVQVIYEDRQGGLWLGTRSQGLNRFDPVEERFERYLHDPEDPESLLDNRVYAVAEDRTGAIWVGTFTGLSRLDRDRGKFTRFVHDPDAPDSLGAAVVYALLVDRQGVLWAGTWHEGLLRYEPEREKLIRYRHDPEDPSSLSSDVIATLYEDRRGQLWVGTDRGLDLFDRDRETFTRYQNDPQGPKTIGVGGVLAVHEDRTGELWVGTVGSGLHRFERATESFVHYPHDPDDPHRPGSNEIRDIHEDRSGILWIATGAGINKFDRNREQFHALRHIPGREIGLEGREVMAILEDRQGRLWVGTLDGGLTALDRRRGTVVTHRAAPGRPGTLSNDEVTAVVEGHGGEVWIGTRSGGLNRLDRARQSFTHYRQNPDDPTALFSDFIRCLAVDRSGDLWIGTYSGGIQRFDVESQLFERHRPEPSIPTTQDYDEIYDIYEDRAGDLWAATFGGLLHLKRGGAARPRSFIHYRYDPEDPHSLSNDNVTSVVEDDAGLMWVGTASAGLNRLDPRRREFRSYWQKDGLPSDKITGLVTGEDGRLWISTANGLSRFDPKTETFRNYDTADGLHGNVFIIGAAHRSARGEIFFGGSGGVTSFFPDRVVDDLLPPGVVLTELLFLNEPVLPRNRDPASPLDRSITVTTDLNLTHRHKVVGFEFAALHFASPRKNRYAYRLEGFDDDWIETGADRRFAQYTNLDPGSYVFRVKASNKDGVWNEEGAAVRIEVLPPPWQTWWAYSLYALVLGAIAAAYQRFRNSQMRREREVDELRSEKEAAEAAQVRLRELGRLKSELFANISHEFRTPLTLTLGPLGDVFDGRYGDVGPAVREQIDLARANAGRVLELINQLLDLARLEAGHLELQARRGDLVVFLRRLYERFMPLAERRRITFLFDGPPSEIELYFDPDQLEKVFSNLLANAFKFTPEGGAVRLSVTMPASSLPEGESGQEAERWVAVRVRDNGPGIPSGELGKIFDRFYQAESSTPPRWTGSGLGLALARELTELHGGLLEADSELGFGTTFVVELRLCRDHLSAAQVVEETDFDVPLAGDEAPIRARMELTDEDVADVPEETVDESAAQDRTTVLMIDDHPDIRAYVRRQLEEEYRVVEAADGVQGLELARELMPDLVVSDVMMPDMDGYALCRELKEDPELDYVPVILLTARAEARDKLEGLHTGADDYLTKPFDARELQARIDNLIASRRRLEAHFEKGPALRPVTTKVVSADTAFLERVQEVIEEGMEEEDFNVDVLASRINMDRSHLYRRLRSLTRQTPSELIRKMRLERAEQLVRGNAGSISEIAYQVGFKSVAHFSRSFRDRYGSSPSAYRSSGSPSSAP